MTLALSTTSGKNSKYGAKKAQQKAGTYQGNSPYFVNIPQFQYLKPLHKDLYPHLRQWPGFRLPNAPRPNYNNNQNTQHDDSETAI